METQSEQLERKAQQARALLTETLEELRAGMTPGQVVDQLADYAREGPAVEFFRNLAGIPAEIRPRPLWGQVRSGLTAGASRIRTVGPTWTKSLSEGAQSVSPAFG